jgi:hypothetical protein
VTVVALERGSVAERGRLEVGMVIMRLHVPRWPFVHGPLEQLSPRDLHDALVPPHDELLYITVKRPGGGTMEVFLRREDPPPAQPFGDEIFSLERFERLSRAQQGKYLATMSARHGRREEVPPPPKPPLAFQGEVTAVVDPRGLAGVYGGSFTSQWVYSSARVAFHCPAAPMRRIELAGPERVQRSFATSAGTVEEGSMPTEMPLWRIRDVVEACRRGERQLASPPVVGTLRCQGQPPRKASLVSRLELDCREQQQDRALFLDALELLSAPHLPAEGPTRVRLKVRWDRLAPSPTEVAVVELDEKGGEVLRHPPLPAPRPLEFETTTEVPVDASRPREVRLALSAKFSDGTTGQSPPVLVGVGK